jgi:hypothetical protein
LKEFLRVTDKEERHGKHEREKNKASALGVAQPVVVDSN